MSKPTKAPCALCNKEFAKAGMTKHLPSCLQKHLESAEPGGKAKPFTHLLITAAGTNVFWLHVVMDNTETLGRLDQFLRGIWLECCGHLSVFSLGRYGEELSMSQKIGKVLSPGTKLDYQYDFGSTTELEIKALATYQVPPKFFKDNLVLLVRNPMPEANCSYCGKSAVEVCTECLCEGEGFLCEACAKKHGCDEDMRLPVVNSPRMGVCAYTGEA